MRKSCAMAIALLSVSIQASERKLKEADVPKAVIDAVKTAHPDAKITGFEEEKEQGKTVYEVSLGEGANKVELDVSPDGKILTTETVIALNAVPGEVQKAFGASKYGKWTVKKVEKVVDTGHEQDPRFEYQVSNAGKRAEVVFANDGKIVKEE